MVEYVCEIALKSLLSKRHYWPFKKGMVDLPNRMKGNLKRTTGHSLSPLVTQNKDIVTQVIFWCDSGVSCVCLCACSPTRTWRRRDGVCLSALASRNSNWELVSHFFIFRPQFPTIKKLQISKSTWYPSLITRINCVSKSSKSCLTIHPKVALKLLKNLKVATQI